MKRFIKRLVRWALRDELRALDEQTKKLKYLTDGVDVSVDFHANQRHYSPSWAVISLQGESQDFIKFVNLGNKDIREIQQFLKQYDKRKIDANPIERDLFSKGVLKF